MTPIRRRKPRGGSREWGKLSKQVAREEPVCWLRFPCCKFRSTGADHYWPVKYRPDLEFVRANLRGACGPCNATRGATMPGDIAALRIKLEAKSGRVRQARAMGFFS